MTELRPTEILTEIRVPVLGNDVGWEFAKLSRRASDFALIGVAVVLRNDGTGTCGDSKVVLGAVGPTPVRMNAVEQALRGKPLKLASAVDAARATVLGPNTPSDVHADAAYRKDVAPVWVRRALEVAITRMTAGRQ